MMKKMLAIVLALLLSVSALAAPLYDFGTVTGTSGDSNLRTGPGLGYKDIGTLHRGECAVWTGDSSVDDRGYTWYSVYFEGKEGWVSGRYTTLNVADAESYTYVRATARVNVRTAPNLNGRDMGTLVKDERVYYMGSSRTDDRGVVWYQVDYYGMGFGWVSSVYSFLEDDWYGMEGIADSYVSTSGKYVTEVRGKSNIRSGAGLEYKDIGTLHNGETASYLGSWSTDDRGVVWYRIRYNGIEGWVSSRYTELH